MAKPAGEAKYSWMVPFAGYDTVLERYSAWLVTQRGPNLPVLDLHSAMRAYFDAVRGDDPQYQLCGDGVHFGPSGHWLVAEQILWPGTLRPKLVDSRWIWRRPAPWAGKSINTIHKRSIGLHGCRCRWIRAGIRI